ncbi:MAG: peptide deformylase [Acidimicrobiales bacterium]
MAILPVVRLPDEGLKRPASPVGAIDASARQLAVDLVDTMRGSPACVGLAANQIGDRRHAFAMDVTGHRKARTCHGLVVLFDVIVVAQSEPELAREGCMSVPDLTGDVPRATAVTVRGTGPDGEIMELTTDAFEARALLHEIDHLSGLLFLDRVASHAAVFRRRTYR